MGSIVQLFRGVPEIRRLLSFHPLSAHRIMVPRTVFSQKIEISGMKPRLLDLRNILLLVGIFFLATWFAILLTYLLISYRGPKGM